ncbi:MAG TPA: hypothetical protein VME21_12220 [Steroidobacteraceae bacterium]|nr:hypothetical protein [Steroidobacteraceae bacterium]
MSMTDVRPILEALVQGLDPRTRAELPADTVLRQPEVVSALLGAIAALEAEAVRARRRAQLPQNVGRAWGEQEEAALLRAFEAGEALQAIAQRHHRTIAGIEARLEALGRLRPEQRTTRNRYVSRAGV